MFEISQELLNRKEKLSKGRKQEIVDSFKEPTKDELILFLLAHLPTDSFNANKETLHRTFFKLRKQFPDLFTFLHFTNNENFPYSYDLDRIFFRLQNCKALSMKNPDYKRFLISDKTKERVKSELTTYGMEKLKNNFNVILKIVSVDLE